MIDQKDFITGSENLRLMRHQKAQLEEEMKTINEAIETQVRELIEYMEATDQLSVKVKGFGTVILTSTKNYSVDQEDPRAAEAFEQFVKSREEWDLVVAPHWKKIHGYYKEKLDLNEELPPGIKTFIKTNITIRGL